ncbi:hypothetical protein BDR04DRAFT_1020503, partial [Suillus decipiens]
ATSVDIECIFSHGQLLLSHVHRQLRPYSVLGFGASWVWFEMTILKQLLC